MIPPIQHVPGPALTLYLAIAALATTHRNLLLGEPQVLPILNIKVELLPFYVIAPLLYLVFHFYLLMMLALLARTAAEFDKQLRSTIPDMDTVPDGDLDKKQPPTTTSVLKRLTTWLTIPAEPERERYRAQVGNALFLQLLVGMKGERTGVNGFLMGVIALITIVLAPLATLILMQMMFLPYHHLRITWWHRAIVVADLVLIMVMTYRCFFPRGVKKAPLMLGGLSCKPRWAIAMVFCVLLAVSLGPLSYWLSFQQGRWAGEPRAASVEEWAQWMEGEPPASPKAYPDYAATANGVVFGLFPDRLKLNDETIVGKEKWEKTNEEMASRKGTKETSEEDNFVPTIRFDDRDLQAAELSGADLRGVSLANAVIWGAELENARLDRARLIAGQLRGADLFGAQLEGAELFEAQLQGTRLGSAKLQGADLSQARLQGTELAFAKLQGADLTGAELQGASLFGARLQGADLTRTELQGAYLSEAELQGANLQRAQLQGADLTGAQLQGADLKSAAMADTDFYDAIVWRTDIADADLSIATIRLVHADQVKLTAGDVQPQPLTQSDVDAWIAAATQFAPDRRKAIIAEQFARLKPDFQQDAQEPTWLAMQEAVLSLDPDHAEQRQRLAIFLGDLACNADGAPYVARGLVKSAFDPEGRLAGLGDQLDAVRDRMKAGRNKPDACKGVAGFTDEDWHQLDALNPAPSAPPSAGH